MLCIDDHAHLGWSQALAFALFGEKTEVGELEVEGGSVGKQSFRSHDGINEIVAFSALVGENDNEDTFVEYIKNFIRKEFVDYNYNIVVLDLRLRWKGDENEDGAHCGITVLDKIKEANAAIPVIIATASRKATNMKTVMKFGADGYFIKEPFNADEAAKDVKKYCRALRRCVFDCASKGYLASVWDLLIREQDYIPVYVLSLLKLVVKNLKDKWSPADLKYFSASSYTEAVRNLGLAQELYLQEENPPDTNVLQLDKHFGHVLDNGALVRHMRNVVSHSGVIKNEFDAKLCLYEMLRCFLSRDDIDWIDLQNEMFHIELNSNGLLDLTENSFGSVVRIISSQARIILSALYSSHGQIWKDSIPFDTSGKGKDAAPGLVIQNSKTWSDLDLRYAFSVYNTGKYLDYSNDTDARVFLLMYYKVCSVWASDVTLKSIKPLSLQEILRMVQEQDRLLKNVDLMRASISVPALLESNFPGCFAHVFVEHGSATSGFASVYLKTKKYVDFNQVKDCLKNEFRDFRWNIKHWSNGYKVL